MMDLHYVETAVAVFTGFALAMRWLLGWLLYPFTPILYLLYLLLLPLLYVGGALWSTVKYPATLFPGSVVETLYIYLSTAAFIGLFTGVILLIVSQVASSLLRRINAPADARSLRQPKRTMQDYRRSRQLRKQDIKNTPLTDLDELGYISPKSLGSWSASPGRARSPGRFSPLSTRAMSDSQVKWARRSLLSSPGTILEEGSSDGYF